MSSESPKKPNQQDLVYYRPLHMWAKTFGILPNFNLKQLQPKSPRPYWNGILMAFLFSAIYLYSTYGKIFHMKNVPSSVFMTDVGGDAALFFANITAIVRISLIKAKHIRKFLNHMQKIDIDLRDISPEIKYPRRVFYLEFISTNVLFVIYYIYDAYIWIDSITIDTYKWLIFRDLQVFHVIVLAMVVRNYSMAIRNRVRILNELLVDMKPPQDQHQNQQENQQIQQNFDLKNELISKINTSMFKGFKNLQDLQFDEKHHRDMFKKQNNHDRIKKEHWEVQRMRRIYARICVSIGIYNDIFGWIYLMLYMTIIGYLLTSSNTALVYGVGDKKIGNNKADFGMGLMILCIVWSALPMIVGFFIFSSADKVFFEIKRTPIICYAIIDGWLPFDEDHVLVPELEKFAQQVTNSHPEITAAGFFAVDYAIFFALIGSLSSYLIVLLSFM